ncbi:hypothetical protein [Streptomyces sp. NPDC007905]|uniref:hypothetical protein n=1 Tax=Streptomyces sp. NPDC007905 TaxID=3364788 RepID=UPI0036E4BACA
MPRETARVRWGALLGSYELTLHAWDVNQSTGCDGPLPPTLVEALLTFAPLVTEGVERTGLFAAPLPPPRPAPTIRPTDCSPSSDGSPCTQADTGRKASHR